MSSETKSVEMAELCQIEEFDAMANEFFATVLGLHYGDCFVSDESCLSDFSFCGMPALLSDNAKSEDLKKQYAAWDEWIISEIAQRYGVELIATTITMVDLFNRIARAATARIH